MKVGPNNKEAKTTFSPKRIESFFDLIVFF